jgi:hypothetical protein
MITQNEVIAKIHVDEELTYNRGVVSKHTVPRICERLVHALRGWNTKRSN